MSPQRPNPAKAAVPSPATLHLINRFTGGYTPTQLRHLERAGGRRAWFRAQLEPHTVRDRACNRLVNSFTDLHLSAGEKFSAQITGVKSSYYFGRDLANVTVLRRAYSHRQVLEQMVDVWSNLLHVPLFADTSWMHRADYDALIRRHALGRYDDLLVAASLHPAMLLYLSTYTSTAAAPNENQGRELLELHTVGRAAGYTEAMVKDSAKILSGWTVDTSSDWSGTYDPDRHATGPVRVLGFTHPNTDPDGRAVTRAYLKYLAHRPATARRVATVLATRFVSDKPSPDLISDLARVYLRHDTAIKPVLLALIDHREFKESPGAKTRTPVEDLVATLRALRVTFDLRTARLPRSATYRSIDNLWYNARAAGQTPFDWPTPDGFPDRANAWTSASRMLSSFNFHYAMSSTWWQVNGAHAPAPAAWLPHPNPRFDDLVDHLHRTMLGAPATRRHIRAACHAVGRRRTDRIHPTDSLLNWEFPRLAAAVLDTPDHMSR